jgi:uncharacterized protein
MMTLVPVLIFIVLGLAILFGSHYFLYLSIVRFFSITSVYSKNLLLAIFVFLSISFLLSSVLAHFRENVFTRAYYFISSFWLGLLVNLILASVIAWLIVEIAHLTDLGLNMKAIGLVLYLMATAYSFYGMWTAFHPRLKNITVTIPDLPSAWKNKKIVQISDVHLGHIYRENFMRSVIAKINSSDPEMVVITGDLFDGMDGNLEAPARPLNDIQAKRGVFFVTGNHETYLGLDIAFSALKNTKVTILKDQVVDIDGLKIIGLSYPMQNEKKNVITTLESLRNEFFGKPNILLYHSPVNIDQFKNNGIDLQLSGHTHAGQIFPFGYITKLIYKGYDYGLYKKDNFTLYTTSGTGTWGPTMRTGNTPEIVVITLR